MLNFFKANSNSGYVGAAGDATSDALQALSHYTYHASGGMLVLCDLQCGLASRQSSARVITDPVIMSRFTGKYGPTDLGASGIRTFFAQHSCNRFCGAHWTRPKDAAVLIPVVAGTTMTHTSFARLGRGRGMAGIAEEDEYYYGDDD